MAVSEWLQLVTSEHALAPNFNAWLARLLQFQEDVDAAVNTIDLQSSVNSASGVQLDRLGAMLGASRVLPFQPVNMPATMTDDLYRLVLKGIIASKSWDGTLGGLNTIAQTLLDDFIVEFRDNQNMSVDVIIISGQINEQVKELIEHGYLFPKPAGVQYNYTVSNQPLFGWDTDTELVKGWDEGIWV